MSSDANQKKAFLFTDIEGSTRILQRVGQDYPQLLSKHAELVRSAAFRHSATEVNSMGDGFFFAFDTVAQATGAAIAAQRALQTHPWPSGGWISVRMGIHFGDAEVGRDGYVGLDVHRTSRICSAGHGGQVLISEAARATLCDKPVELSFADIGTHFLKDLENPERLWQVAAADLPSDFPPLRSKNVRPNNLPLENSKFVGRDSEINAGRSLVASQRLVTILGPGGVGKSRLALRLAAEVLPEFEDGAFWVPLAEVKNSSEVAGAIAKHADVSSEGFANAEHAVTEHFSDLNALLVLDNFEQVLGAGAWLSKLLAAAPGLTVLVTSRILLNITGEHTIEARPFQAEDALSQMLPEKIARNPAVEIFVNRAAMVRPGFKIDAQNAASIARLVAGLDGLPLAIELAAARVRMFAPQQLADRLDQRLKLLRGGQSDMPERHKALQETIRWSTDLLSQPDLALFRRLAVFEGSFCAEIAEDLGAGDPVWDVLESLQSLLDNSLVQSRIENGETRFFLLETIRDFAMDLLQETGEENGVRELHLSAYVSLLEEAEPNLSKQSHGIVVDRLNTELGNIRGALRFAVASGDHESGLRISTSAWRFWHASGLLTEGRRWIEGFNAQDTKYTNLAGKQAYALGSLSYWQSDYRAALEQFQKAFDIYRLTGNELGIAESLLSLSTTEIWSGEIEKGLALARQSREIFSRLGRLDMVGMVTMAEGFAAWQSGNLEEALPLWNESMQIATEVGDEVEAATKRLAIAAIQSQMGNKVDAFLEANKAFEDCVRLRSVSFTIMAADWVAALGADFKPAQCASIAGAVSKLRKSYGGGLTPEQSGLTNGLKTAEQQLGVQSAQAAWQEGQNYGYDQLVDYTRLCIDDCKMVLKELQPSTGVLN